MPISLAALTTGGVKAALVQMAQAVTTQLHGITSKATRDGALREKPHASTMASRPRDFTRMNPPVYFESRTIEDPQEFVDEVHKILCAMGVKKMIWLT